MFKVKATVLGFDNDEIRHPCHFQYKIGDIVIWDGEKFIGRICPSILRPFSEKVSILYTSGGRHREGEVPGQYLPFFHSPYSVYDPEYKKYDGVGFRPTLERPEQNYKYIPDVTLFDEPPGGELLGGPGTGERKKEILVCGDKHTLMRMEFEAFDLVDYGDGLPYARRALSILNKISKKPVIAVNKIIEEFDDDERDNIYPTLGQNIIWSLVGELAVLDYITLDGDRDGKVAITDKGKEKLENFKKSLTQEERSALKL
ncbi:MAG: TIGR04076 family protein [Dehalococcoidales bacterium]|nr:MAG: TIGR04076 family protein [Dehalococcoidales bacterium]